MSTIVACKLPHGLTIRHNGETININGSNADADPLSPTPNGQLGDSAILSAGFGLTTLSGAQEDAFNDWVVRAQYKVGEDGNAAKANGTLDEPFLPLVKGTLETYKSDAEARKDTRAISADVSNGMDGLDGDAEMKKAAQDAGLVPETGVSQAQR